MKQAYKLPSSTGLCDLEVCLWETDAPRAVVQLTHGMAEHIGRYDDFAAFLNRNDVVVTGFDLPGHGESVGADKRYGYFAQTGGWDRLVEDMRAVYSATKARYPGLPYILFGHSMGSFLARAYASRHGEDVDAFIFSGTAGPNPALPAARMIAQSQIKKYGGTYVSKTLNDLSFGAYNKAFAPARTEFDWLSRDTAKVDEYVADPLCGFVFTAAGFRDMFSGLKEVGAKNWASKVPKKPILILSGEKDPVGGKAASGVRKVAAGLTATGHDVLLLLYPGGRHEMLNETNREEVYADILDFIRSRL